MRPARDQTDISWEHEPPKSETEQWNWQRRGELWNMAAGILVERLRHGESWHGNDEQAEWIRDAVNTARALQVAVDAARPRL